MSDEELAKDLGPLAALTIGVGTMIGAGIFVLPGAAVEQAGPLSAAAFVLGGGIALLTALSASELGTAMPKAGGAYYYINQGLGPLFGSVAGWGNWMGLAFASAFYMFGFGEYVVTVVPVPGILGIPPAKLVALLGAGLFVLINYVGAKETGRLQNIIVITLVSILAVFTAVGALNADLETLRPFAPNGYDPLLPVTGLVFVSYLGFVQITSVAEEVQEPGKNLPRAIIGSVVLVTTVYALVLLVVLGAVPNELVAGNPTAVVDAADLLLGPYLGVLGGGLLLFGGLLATASSANASILASSRINFAMGRDRLVAPSLNEIHERFGTPYRSIALTGAFILLFIAVSKLQPLAKVGSILHLIIYALLNIALIVMREADAPDYEPDFRVPFYPVTPILGAVLSLALIGFFEAEYIALSIAFVVFSVAWYFLYARGKTEAAGVLSDYILKRPQEMPEAAVQAASSVQPEGGRHRVMVALANPEHEADLISLGSAIAKRNAGTVVVINVVQVPDQTPLAAARQQGDHEAAHDLLERARADAETFGIDVETHTILSHRSFEEVFDAARQFNADTAIMGWGPDSHGSPGRAESAFDDLSRSLPCDFLVLKDRGFDLDRVVVPTAGGPDSDISANIAATLQAEFGAEVTLLHVADDQDEGERFLREWALDHGLSDADLRVETGDVETAIEDAATEASLLIMGATERGLLSRLVRGSLVMDVVDDVDCSVLLAEKAHSRGLRERLFG